MNLAYVTVYDAADVLQWSGLGNYIYRALCRPENQVECLGPLPAYARPRKNWLRAKQLWHNTLLRGTYGWFSAERDHAIAKHYSNAVHAILKQFPYDLVVSPGTIPVAFLDSDVPVVIWADATFHSLVTTYPEYEGRTQTYYADGESLECAALSRAALCVFTSEWAANSAVDHYRIDPRKVAVVPFGANLEEGWLSEHDITQAILNRDNGTLRLTFLGVDFERKGGPKVLQVVRDLIAMGVPVRLDIVGCVPVLPTDIAGYTTVHGFLSKATEQGRQRINDILLSSHWLILLPSAECYGLVFAEANRYGVPCIGTRVGGIPTLIRDGSNGQLFSASTPSREIAAYIASLFSDRTRYEQLARRSYSEYSSRLNWKTAGDAFAAHLRSIVQSPKNPNPQEKIPPSADTTAAACTHEPRLLLRP